MGSGSFSSYSFAKYSKDLGRQYDDTTGRVSGQTYTATRLSPKLDPKNVVRECCNSEEHPNTIPVILALDVTGSMGRACKETAEALGTIMTDLYARFNDVQIMVMGIGDLAYDDAPIQISQFESDVRIAEWLDMIYMEHGGGGNGYESYTAAWYMGAYHCKLDCWNQGRKGIIITMGDEPLNPYLPETELSRVTGDNVERHSTNTLDLYTKASEKFDIFHIAVDDSGNCYRRYKSNVDKSFGEMLKEHYKVSKIQNLGKTICDCIEVSVVAIKEAEASTVVQHETKNDGISW